MIRRRIKIEDWPAQDRVVWDALLEPGSLLSRGGAFAHLRPSTLWSREQSYGHWLAFCRLSGLSLADSMPVERASEELINAWAEEMSDLRWTTRHTRLVGLLTVLQGMAPNQPQDLLRDLCRDAEWHAKRQVREGKIGRIFATGTLFDAGMRWMESVEGTSFKNATQSRDGLMVATLALLVLRGTNFRDLEIGHSFLVRPDGFVILIAADTYKTHRILEKELPDILVEPMRRYLEIYRPTLITKSAAPHDFLWVNDWGNRYSHSSLGARISRLTKKMLGIPIPPHLFRDAAATSIARAVPSKRRAIAGALGHATQRTADRHYNQARTLDASRAFTPLIEEFVEEAASAQSRRRR